MFALLFNLFHNWKLKAIFFLFLKKNLISFRNKNNYRQRISFIPLGNQTQSCLHDDIEAKSSNVNPRVAVRQRCPESPKQND